MAESPNHMSQTAIATLPEQEVLVPMRFAGATPLRARDVSMAGISRYRDVFILPYAAPAFHLLLYTIAGTASLRWAGHTVELLQNSLWVVPAGLTYQFLNGDGPWEAMWFRLRPTARWAHLQSPSPQQRPSAASHRMVHIMTGLIAEPKLTADESRLQMGKLFAEILGMYLERRLHPDGYARWGDRRDALGEVWERVDADLAHAWSVEELADLAHLSVTHFHRLVKHYHQLSPAEMVARLRLQRAQELLLHTTSKLDRIAAQVGYGSAAALSKAFKRLWGVCPLQYRLTGDTSVSAVLPATEEAGMT